MKQFTQAELKRLLHSVKIHMQKIALSDKSFGADKEASKVFSELCKLSDKLEALTK